jgi:hypothetical protein
MRFVQKCGKISIVSVWEVRYERKHMISKKRIKISISETKADDG